MKLGRRRNGSRPQETNNSKRNEFELPGLIAEHGGKMTEVTFELCGFSELEKRLACIATVMTANLFFPNGNYPPLRSNPKIRHGRAL
jgi:hypothetical protein